MTSFAPCAANLPPAPADPGRRVHYTHGLVLGVAELTQEFAYLAGRDQWALRDLVGYGTVSGLRVETILDSERGPRIVVSSGAAVSPGGRLVRVAAAQEAVLNEWLDVNRGEVSRRADIDLGSPPTASIELHLVLCYRERLTAMVPGPGTPCRSEDVPTVASRIVDDFALELRLDRPMHREDGELTRFVSLLPQIEVVETGGVLRAEFLDALRLALTMLTSPPSARPELVSGSPPGRLQVRADDLCDFLRAALRLWVTEVRPQVQDPLPDTAGCASPGDEDCILLATLRVPITFTDRWRVDTAVRVVVDEDHRPILGHTRLLQEWLLCATQPAAQMPGAIVAAGRLRGTTVLSSRGNLRSAAAPTAGRVKLTFNGYQAPSGGEDYVVKALPARLTGATEPVVIDFGGYDPDGFVLLATRAGADLAVSELAGLELQVEVSRL